MRSLCRALMLFVVVIFADDCLAHPDLLAQIAILDQRLAADPGNAELLLKRGDLYRRHEDYTSAERDFTAASKANPDEPLLDFYRGRLLFETGDDSSAGVLVDRYLAAHPEHAKAWILMGRIQAMLGEYTRAADSFGQAIEHSQAPSPDIYRLKTWSHAAAGKASWPDALGTVDEGLDRFSTEISLLGAGTDIALAAGDTGRAEQYLSVVPDGLYRLDQWKDRVNLLSCLVAGEPAPNSGCQSQARDRVDQVIKSFIVDIDPEPGPGFSG